MRNQFPFVLGYRIDDSHFRHLSNTRVLEYSRRSSTSTRAVKSSTCTALSMCVCFFRFCYIKLLLLLRWCWS